MFVSARSGYVYVLLVLAALLPGVPHASAQLTPPPGGIVELAGAPASRPPISADTWRALLPARGPFTFPAPYGTAGIRLTGPADCGGGDCVLPVGYAYWRNTNNHVGSDTILIALSLDRRYGGTGPTLFSYNKDTGLTRNVGPLFDSSHALSWSSGEGWYFSATRPSALYVNHGSRMLRYDVLTKTSTTVVDLSAHLGANRVIWQMHSSQDDRVHSFTVKDGSTYADLGCGLFVESSQQFRLFSSAGEFDECQIDASGRFLVVKENADGQAGLDNVIHDLVTGTSHVQGDPSGALGHSDVGFGYGVGEDNWYNLPAAVRVWRYGGGVSDGRVVFHATDWAFGGNHITHTNARADQPLEQQMACSSNANRLQLPRANEVLCYLLDASLRVLVVAPVMTSLDARGGGTDDYAKMPKGNLDVTGEYFLWTSNTGGDRLDAFMVRVPRAQLGTVPPPPTGSPTAPVTSPVSPPASSSECTTVRPGDDWTCVNGGWVPPTTPPPPTGGSETPVPAPVAPAPEPSTSSCTSVRPGPSWECHSGAWLPPGMQPRDRTTAPAPSSPSAPATSTSGCSTVQPGPGWVCRNGGWLPPGHPGSY